MDVAEEGASQKMLDQAEILEHDTQTPPERGQLRARLGMRHPSVEQHSGGAPHERIVLQPCRQLGREARPRVLRAADLIVGAAFDPE